MIRKTTGTSVASLVLCAFLWSSSGILIKLVDWDPFAISGVRSIIGFITMLFFLRRPHFTFSADQLLAALFYSLTMILFVIANKLTSSANAVLLQYTEPVYIILFGRFLLADERSTWIDWFAVIGVLAGMVLFFLDELSLDANTGNILAILSGVSFALTTIFMRRQKNGRPADSFMLSHLLTFAVSIPFIIRAGPPDLRGSMGLVLLGVLQIGIPSFLYGWGVAGVTAVSTALITMIEPVMNPVWVALFVHELPTPRAIAGGVVILLSVAARTVLKMRKIY